ncbi:glutamate--tRNA ligase [Candidatus Gottesmanbacteria bacterium]|nr:glutamate--tRNA ligase [Candidatus Gottesmanbacteria bacterium]
MTTIRTRIAPSPTGQDLHIGNAYTALINYVFAKKNNGQFIVRIEDTDRTRLVQGSEERILNSLKWLGIAYDESVDKGGPFAPYRQSERLALYKKYAQELVDKGHAYYCFCTQQRLAQMRRDQEAKHQPPMYDGRCRKLKTQSANWRTKFKAQKQSCVIRLKVPKEGTTNFTDLIRGEISFENNLIDDQVLLKSDGYPTYHLGVVVDDHSMNITHVIRGEEWISSTPKHILLYQLLGWELPQYAHVPLLRNPDKSKLSKRKNPVWISWYKEQGYLPQALLNYLATLAWAHPDGKEIFSLDDMIQSFTLERIQTTAPIFDVHKCRWINHKYLQMLSPNDFISIVSASVAESQFQKITRDKHFASILTTAQPLVQPRISTPSEYFSIAGFLHVKPTTLERPIKQELLDIAKKALLVSRWDHNSLEKTIRQEAKKLGVNARDVFMELRLAVTGKTVGPPLLESLEILGKEETMQRISNQLTLV